MKKFLFTMITLLGMAVSSHAMSYEQARQQALFLADKMAYELNLTDDQYEACYEINLDYLMGVTCQDDLYGVYWERRNLDLSYILLDWQYRMFLDATYFYRPLYWDNGFWHFGIYARYPHRDYFFFGRPGFFDVYRGGHSWGMNGGHSWYHGREFGGPRGTQNHGMRDGFNNGDYGRGGNMQQGQGGRGGQQGQQGAVQGQRGQGQQGTVQGQRGGQTTESSTRATAGMRRGETVTTQQQRSTVFGGATRDGMRQSTTTGRQGTQTTTRSTGGFSTQRSVGGTVQRSTGGTVTTHAGEGGFSRSSGGMTMGGGSRGGSGFSTGGGSRSGGGAGGGGSHGGGSFGGGRR